MAYYGAPPFDQLHQYQQQFAHQFSAAQAYAQSHAVAVAADPQKTTLWMGELEPYMDENFIKQIWYAVGENVQVKMIRDKYSGQNAGYCFVDFGNHPSAVKALTTLQGTFMPGTNRAFRLNWASGGGMNDRRSEDRMPEYSVFVGDLAAEVTDQTLYTAFQGRYPSLKTAKVVTDPATGGSRGYGFVRFHDEADQTRALTEMQGAFCGSRPMRISMATPKNKAGGDSQLGGMAGGMGSAGGGQPYYPQAGPIAVPQGLPLNQFTDPNNTTVFVGGLSGVSSEDELRGYFAPFGDVTYVKIPPGKGCGFVQFMHRHSAEMAIAQLNGIQIGNSRVRLSWGRAQSDKGYRHQMYPQAVHNPLAAYAAYGMHSQHPMMAQVGGFLQAGIPPTLPQAAHGTSAMQISVASSPQQQPQQPAAQQQQQQQQQQATQQQHQLPQHSSHPPQSQRGQQQQPQQQQQQQQQQQGVVPAASQPADSMSNVPTEKQNEGFIGKESMIDCMETEGKSWHRSIYAQ